MIFQPNMIANIVEPTERGHSSPPLPPITHLVGYNRYPLTVPRNSSVFLAHYSGIKEPFSGPVKRLTVLQVGSCEAPNMTPYSNSCATVDFNGHIASSRAAFELISQMPRVNKVAFLIGHSQQHPHIESYDEFMRKTPVCPSVKKLKVILNLDNFHSFHHDCSGANYTPDCATGYCLSDIQYSLICLVESIFKHAGDSFPNLRNLIVELPENQRVCNAVQMLIQTCPQLRAKTQTAVQNIFPNNEKAFQMQSVNFGSTFRQDNIKFVSFENSQAPYENSFISTNARSRGSVHAAFRVNHENSELNSPTSEGNFEMIFQNVPVTQHCRPPPGFSPLPSQSTVNSESSKTQDVHHRINTWLRNLQK